MKIAGTCGWNVGERRMCPTFADVPKKKDSVQAPVE